MRKKALNTLIITPIPFIADTSATGFFFKSTTLSLVLQHMVKIL